MGLTEDVIGRGSSPRIRGTPASDHLALEAVGLTPVYTGNTSRRHHLGGRAQAHPRVYGEHFFSVLLIWPAYGSPPCIRGTRGKHLPTSRRPGLTPVYTGNTLADKA